MSCSEHTSFTVWTSVTRFTACSTLPCHCVARLFPFTLAAGILAVLSIGFSLAVYATDNNNDNTIMDIWRA